MTPAFYGFGWASALTTRNENRVKSAFTLRSNYFEVWKWQMLGWKTKLTGALGSNIAHLGNHKKKDSPQVKKWQVLLVLTIQTLYLSHLE